MIDNKRTAVDNKAKIVVYTTIVCHICKMNFPNIEKLDPQSCVSGMITRSQRIVSNVFRKHLLPFDITSSQLGVLFVVTKGVDVNQKKLGDILHMDKSTVTRNLKRAFDKGWITKDGSLLKTTNNGLDFLETVLPEWEKAMTEIKEKLEK